MLGVRRRRAGERARRAPASGTYHTCALQDDGTVDCWGNNSAGQASVPPGLNLDVGDVTAPLTTVNSAVDGSGARMVTGAETLSSDIAITFSGTDDVGIMEFQCSLDSASYVACSSPITHSALLVGAHTFLVTAVDGAGNVSVPAS